MSTISQSPDVRTDIPRAVGRREVMASSPLFLRTSTAEIPLSPMQRFNLGMRISLEVSRMTCADLARAVDKNPNWVRRRLAGRTPWTLCQVIEAADILGTTVTEVWRRGEAAVADG